MRGVSWLSCKQAVFGRDKRSGSCNNELSMAIVPWYCQHVRGQADEKGACDSTSEHT
jgi:hypothetical protein